MACWTESLASLVYAGKKMPSVPCQLGLPHIAMCFIKYANQADEREAVITSNVITEMASCQFCHLLLFTGDHRPCSQLRGSGLYREGCKYQEKR